MTQDGDRWHQTYLDDVSFDIECRIMDFTQLFVHGRKSLNPSQQHSIIGGHSYHLCDWQLPLRATSEGWGGLHGRGQRIAILCNPQPQSLDLPLPPLNHCQDQIWLALI